MGKLLNEREIISKNINTFIENSTGEYSRFLDDASPNFVSYYRKNILQSTTDLGLENAERIIDSKSSIKFDRIEYFPIFGIDPFSLSLNREEIGADSEVNGSAIIVPNTIKPLPDDFFTFPYIGKKFLFRITNVTNDKVHGKMFYRVDFQLTKILKEEDDVDEIIVRNMVCVLTNIGTDNKSILLKQEFLDINYLEQVYNELYKFYAEYYYNKKFNIFTTQINDKSIYCQQLINFINENEVFKPNKSFQNDFYIEDFLKKDMFFLDNYRTSIFNAVVKQNSKTLNELGIFLKQIPKNNSPYFNTRETFFNIFFVPYNMNDEVITNIFIKDFYKNIKVNKIFMSDYVCKEPELQMFDFVSDNFKVPKSTIIPIISNTTETEIGTSTDDLIQTDSTSTDTSDLILTKDESTSTIDETLPEYLRKKDENELTPHKDFLFENLIINYINNDLKLETKILDEINDYFLVPSIRNFFFIPIIMYILNNLKNRILNKID